MAERSREISLAGYAGLLAEFRAAGYTFRSFRQALDAAPPAPPWVVLRHDVDNHPALALDMARTEAEAGISSTYFFLLRSELYNLLSAEGSRCVRRILQLGHRLGLHLDATAYPVDGPAEELAAACRREARLLEDWFGSELDAVSFHRPDARALAGDPALTAPYPHTYMRECSARMTYLSDSRGRFREGWPTDHEAFRSRRPIQLLTHPLWWGREARAPLDTLQAFLEFEARCVERALAANSTVFRDAAAADGESEDR